MGVVLHPCALGSDLTFDASQVTKIGPRMAHAAILCIGNTHLKEVFTGVIRSYLLLAITVSIQCRLTACDMCDQQAAGRAGV